MWPPSGAYLVASYRFWAVARLLDLTELCLFGEVFLELNPSLPLLPLRHAGWFVKGN